VLNADARIGRHTILNTGTVVEHDGVVGDAVHLAPRVCLAGHVTVGDRTFVGAGTVVRDEVRIGRDCLVGLGSVVVRDLPDGVRAYGCPAAIKETP
jgi:acyl-[acyl carrier protein]--UDP-N-acetylglucosamine O-acyltransferase